jgi:putative MATE family efflux protein
MTYINSNEEKRIFYRLVFSLVLPMTLQNLINVGVTSADVIMLGKVSEISLSGASLAGQVQFIMTLVFFGLTSGAAVLTAQYWGKKDVHTIEKILGITMRFALVTAVIFTVAVLFFPGPIMSLFTSEEAVRSEGVQYLKIISFAYIFMAVTMIYLNIMRSVERVVISTVVYLVSLIVNVILAFIFIFGLFGVEPMGIRGAALATLIARIIEFLIVFIYANKINRQVKFHIKNLFIKDKVLMKDFLTYAFPVMLNELIWGAGTSTNAAIIGHLGSAAVAANSVTQVTRQLAMVIAFGLANATAITIGKAIGEHKEELAKVYAKRFVRLTLVVGIVGAGVILVVSQIAQNQLTLSTDAKYYLKIMMFVMSYFAVCQAYNTTMIVGVFRAGGDTKYGLLLDVSTLWGCSILFGALAAFVWKLPIPIVYMIIMSDEIIKIPLSTLRYKSYKWLRNVTRD